MLTCLYLVLSAWCCELKFSGLTFPLSWKIIDGLVLNVLCTFAFYLSLADAIYVVRTSSKILVV